jgi:polyhydroxyalkanoate synthesis regulator protein
MLTIHAQADRTLTATEDGRTLAWGDLLALVREGVDFQILEEATGKDVTNRYLAELFVREDLDAKQTLFKRYILETLLQDGNKLEGLVKKLLWAGVGAASLTQEKLTSLVDALASRGETSEAESAVALRSLFAKAETLPSKLQSGFETVMQKVKPVDAAADDLAALSAKVDALADSIERLLQDRTIQEQPSQARSTKKPTTVA